MALLVRLDNIISIPVQYLPSAIEPFFREGTNTFEYFLFLDIINYMLILKRLNSLVYKVPFPLTDLSLLNTSSFKLGSDYVLHNRIILLYGICVVKHTCQ